MTGARDVPSHLVVVSNRLPFRFDRDTGGEWRMKPGSGGLVTALLPVLRDRGGVWIGWPGGEGFSAELAVGLKAATANSGYTLAPVPLDRAEIDDFYQGFANEIIWPLFHDLHEHCNFEPRYWHAYRRVNRRYAEVVAKQAGARDFIWVHDYHLIHVAAELHDLGVSAPTGFFLHIPFPPLDTFLKLPWRFQLLDALLQYDLIGFQTPRDQRNFLQCLRALVKDATIQGKGKVVTARIGERELRIGSFPISIDFNQFEALAADHSVAEFARRLHAALPDRQLVLGVDRLDYTKGIPHRLKAFGNALERHPELREHITLIQVVVPSREDIPRYHALRVEIESLVGEINGRYTRPGGWVPIHYVFRSLQRAELLGYYRAAQIALITPLKDGMNLVAKEYCACNVDEHGVLILSEFAGAAAQLQHGALLVNPYDVEGVADAIHHAHGMATRERQARMRRLRRSVRENDVFRWVDSFLNAAIARDLSSFLPTADYVPSPQDTLSALPE